MQIESTLDDCKNNGTKYDEDEGKFLKRTSITAQKMKFSIKGYSVTFTEEIVDGKLHFLYSA